MRPEGAKHTAPSRGIACVLAAALSPHTGRIASSEKRGFPPQGGMLTSGQGTAGPRRAADNKRYEEQARGFIIRRTTAKWRRTKCHTYEARAMPSVVTTILPYVNRAARLV